MDISLWLLLFIAGIVFIGFASKSKTKPSKPAQDKSRQYQRTSPPQRRKQTFEPQAGKENNTAERQLITVRENNFYKRTLMNKSEFALFCKLERFLAAEYPSYRIFSQVSLGEILGSDSKPAYWAINSKRADFVVIDRAGQPVTVIEYQGTGHYQGDAEVRDAVKREACHKAGIGFIEVPAHYLIENVMYEVRPYLTGRAA